MIRSPKTKANTRCKQTQKKNQTNRTHHQQWPGTDSWRDGGPLEAWRGHPWIALTHKNIQISILQSCDTEACSNCFCKFSLAITGRNHTL